MSDVVFRMGERVILRPVERADAPAMRRWVNDPEVTQYLMRAFPLTEREEETWIDSLGTDDRNIVVAIVDREHNKLIGSIGLHNINWRHRTAMTGTIIGALVGASEFFAGVGAVVAAPVARRMRAHWLVVAFVGGAILFIVITPLIGQFLVLLVVAAALRGLSQGVNQPVMYSILSRSVGPDAQGAAVGLRNTVNRLSSLILPTAMGLAAGQWGIEASFYVMGIVLLATCGGLAMVIRYKRTFED
jgi:MFS family permease